VAKTSLVFEPARRDNTQSRSGWPGVKNIDVDPLFASPVSETIIAGDINGDGKVDWLDLDILARNWLRDVRE